MEHPLRVEEFDPSEAPQVVRAEPVAAATVQTAAVALPPLPALPATDAVLLRPSDPDYTKYLPAANTRTQLSPSLRAICKTEHAVAVMIDWVCTNNLSF